MVQRHRWRFKDERRVNGLFLVEMVVLMLSLILLGNGLLLKFFSSGLKQNICGHEEIQNDMGIKVAKQTF